MSYQAGLNNLDTSAHRMFKQLLNEGKPANEAAKIAQEKTGISLVTGRMINKRLEKRKDYVGQY